ncbi:hypothetical protein Apa02nite_070510 [Actinoplanes palleronii]|uniref:CDP-diglyceride synthetase n=3 Tax=Micromonosporaceae TaxID=28056 RepID=A0A101J969_9ACTN|nr:hypothetical protein ADL15_48125 [Actinoplanes awajinensis subsp. mycoplanecinus]GIE70943.1 hypothetical protein Apa02nite_070510 [Actinoplanes palleronii]
MPQDDPWDADASRDVARLVPGRPKAGTYGAVPDDADDEQPPTSEPEPDEEEFEEIEVVPVRAKLSVAIGGFAALLALALIIGTQTTGPDARAPYAIVLFGVQLLGLLAWTMALNPPAVASTAAISGVTGLAACYLAVTADEPGLMTLLYVAGAGFVAALIGQLIRAEDRHRVGDSWRTTLLIVLGVVAYAVPITLTRQPLGSQAILVCCTGAGLALLVSRLTDAVFPKPRIAAQVPRGAAGIVLGAMVGTFATAWLGSQMVLPFTPAKGAVAGLVAAVAAILIDLAVNFGEAGRRLAGEAPTFWLARHMTGPLGGFALTFGATYVLVHFYLG